MCDYSSDDPLAVPEVNDKSVQRVMILRVCLAGLGRSDEPFKDYMHTSKLSANLVSLVVASLVIHHF